MLSKTRERGKDGRFIALKNGLEDAFDICYLFTKLLPMILIVLFLLNYFGLWMAINKAFKFLLNIGNPLCEFKCIEQAPAEER